MEFCFQPKWNNRDWTYPLYWDNQSWTKYIHKTMVFKSWDIWQWKAVMYEWLGKWGEARDCSSHHLESVSWPQQRGRRPWQSLVASLSKGVRSSWRPQWLSSQVRVLERLELQREASETCSLWLSIDQCMPQRKLPEVRERITQKSLEWLIPRAHAVPRMDFVPTSQSRKTSWSSWAPG